MDSGQSGIGKLAGEQGWEVFSEVPGARWASGDASGRNNAVEFQWPETKFPPGTPEYVYVGVAGAHGGYTFTARQFRAHKRVRSREGAPIDAIRERSILQVAIRSKVPTCTFRIGWLTPWKIRQSNAKTQLRPEFARWFRRNQLRFRKFRTGPTTLTLELDKQLTARTIVRGLEFLLDVADQLPIDLR